MKTVGDASITYHILYHYLKISKIRQKFKNSLIVKKKSTSQVSDIIVNACMQFENFPIKTVEEAFYSFYIIHHYFKISKIRQKLKNSPIVKKKAQAR